MIVIGESVSQLYHVRSQSGHKIVASDSKILQGLGAKESPLHYGERLLQQTVESIESQHQGTDPLVLVVGQFTNRIAKNLIGNLH